MFGSPLRWVWFLSLLASLCHGFDGDALDSTGCPAAFKEKCSCKKQRYSYWMPNQELFVVNCTNSGFKDTNMLEHLPTGTQVLIFNGNHVPVLDWNVIGIWDDHKDLEVIDMSNNHIAEISGKAFHKVSSVKRLVLDHNDLSISGSNLHERMFTNFYNLERLHLTNAFTETIDSKWYLKDLRTILLASNMTKLKILHLEQNEIWRIDDDDMFCGLPALTDLYLGDNQLNEINFSLSCLKQLRYLDLEYNKMERFRKSTLNLLEEVFGQNQSKTLNLQLNPFDCDCNLKNFHSWFMRTKAVLHHKDEYRCFKGYPDYNAGLKLSRLEHDKLQCRPQNAGSKQLPHGQVSADEAGASTLTNVLLCLLIIVVSVVGGALVYNNCQKVRESVKPLVVSFQKSMQYRTIEKDEEPVAEVNV